MSARQTCSRVACRDGSIAYTFRGSEYGMCAHRHIANLRGMVEAAVDAKTRLYFKAGNEGEVIAKDLLHDLAAKDPRLGVEEYASGWQNQTSVTVTDKRLDSDDGIDREVRLVCSPDGRLSSLGDIARIFAAAGWLKGYVPDAGDGPAHIGVRGERRQYALEVKVYGDSSEAKFIKKGAAAFPTLEWQTSGVSAGYEKRLEAPVGVVCLILRREPVKDEAGNVIDFTVPRDQVPSVWVYDRPRYTARECLNRCWGVVDAYEAGKWEVCDNSYFCRYPHRPTPVLDVVAESMLESLHKAWQAFQLALRDAEGLLIGRQNGDVVSGYTVCRQLLSVPLVRPLGA